MWQKIKEIPPFISSIVAIIAALVGLIIWVFGYFATRTELEKAKCWADINIKINAKQIQQTLLLGERYQLKNTIQELENTKASAGLTGYEEESLKEQIEQCKSNEDAMNKLKTETERLIEVVRSGQVIDSDGQCRE